MRPVAFGEALTASTRLTLFSDDKPDRFFTVIKFWMDETSGVVLELKTGVPTYQVEDEEGRTHLLIQLPIGEDNENRWVLWRTLNANNGHTIPWRRIHSCRWKLKKENEPSFVKAGLERLFPIRQKWVQLHFILRSPGAIPIPPQEG
jgi:hypothetical protein